MQMNPFFPEIKKNFGFGLMRLPMDGQEVNMAETAQMVDAFLEAGFNYFDTAHGYIDGRSEIAVRECLTKRYPRDRYLLTNKLSSSFFEKEEDIRPLFEAQLAACGVEYFDFYLMHAQNGENFKKYKQCRAYETALELKKEGKIRHVGLSFHDTADVLDRILTEYPQMEAVQIQFNYVDYEDLAVQSRAVYEVCVKHGKPVIVMEPVKGGSLVNLPEEACRALDALAPQDGPKPGYAGYALRYAAGFPQMCMTLSGMSSLQQMRDNIETMREFRPLDEKENAAVQKVCEIFRAMNMVPCTSCHYCVLDNKCPKDIMIPEMFECYNRKSIFHSWNQDVYYRNVLTRDHGRASDCLRCGKCEKICPQHLPIRSLLEKVAAEFDA